ncbi:uncharacterized protein N0V89_005106 [Didymosphaeria variabile]|uniref:Secreted protein n=1 Tax=Didymosphaeria variabile TaxID=1932322 RepID=A0A9W9CAX0_9PLEO|nr:uncharacterized protein N0V89_005106 [Didymosphaeria variabile]KAJ4353377.1 hypothetical protein N0V89_005106 [Didymosphaeria variabile]
MSPLTSWAIFLVFAAGIAWKCGVFDKLSGKKPEQSGTRGRTLSRSTDTKMPDWVQSESNTKSNTKATKKQAPRKSVKKAVQEVGNKAEATLSGVSSTTGADADDDLSPDQSPSLAAKVANVIPSGKDVSDMLDPKIVPGVLKIGASEKPARPAKPQQQKSETQKQTKKQAQNAKKRESEKAAKAEAEVERKKLQEQQLRTARLARGEAPGTRYQTSGPGTNQASPNVWNSTGTPAATKPVTGQLLDTIDAASSASSATNGTAPTPDSTSYDNFPSEEDQIAAALADSAWTEVPKGKKKKTTKAEVAVGDGSDSGIGYEAPAPVKATPAPAPKKENKKEVKPASRYEVLSAPVPGFSDPRDSDWPVV